MSDILYKEESYAIVGAAMQVHSTLGCGFVEKVYQEALEIEFTKRGIPFEREKRLLIEYKGQILKTDFYVDFLCFDLVLVLDYHGGRITAGLLYRKHFSHFQIAQAEHFVFRNA